MTKAGLLGGVAAILLLAGAGCPAQKQADTTPTPSADKKAMVDTSPIKLGWLGPLTGDAASIGKDALAAAEIAVGEVNSAGGINGRNLELVVEDGKCNPKDAADAGNKLINIDKVPVIVGGTCSGETMAVAPVAEQNKVVVFSYCSSAPTVTDAGDYIFRSYPSDAFQGKYAAGYVYNTLNKKKVAVLAVLGDWGTGVKNSFVNNFPVLGGEVVFVEDYPQDARDLRTQLTKIKDAKPELLYFIGYTEASIAGLRQAKELGLTMPIFGADAWDDAKIHENDFASGISYVVAAVTSKDTAFIDRLKAKNADNTICAPGSYNNVKIVADIMKRVGADSIKIKDELYKVKDYPGVNGAITLDQNGDLATAAYEVKMVKDKKAEVVK